VSDTTPKTLAAALVALQANMPRINKGETAKVQSTKGSYSYTYADLADVSAQLLPVMSEVGLAFTARPTMQDGRFVLAYSLMHASGEREDGFYPLPDSGTPQAIGSAITYARRYCLLSVTGAAPDNEDDDGKAAMDTRAGAPSRSQTAPRSEPDPTPEEREFVSQVTEQVAAATSTDELNRLWAQVKAAADKGLTTASAENLTGQMKRRAQQLNTPANAA
jgi:hypothetical protein